MIFLISFVLVLSLSGNVLAKDLNPPNFAGGNQTGVIFWEFNEDKQIWLPQLRRQLGMARGRILGHGWW
jgi:hypothetical protein